MGLIEDFPTSEFAKNRARRDVDEAMAEEDFVERVVALIGMGNSGLDVTRDLEPGTELTDVFGPGFRHGIRIAVRTLLESGLAEVDFPIDELKNRVARVSLASSMMTEATYEGDVADLYLAADGGNG